MDDTTTPNAASHDQTSPDAQRQPPLNSLPVSADMDDTTTAAPAPPAQPAPDPLREPRGYMVFTGNFDKDRRLRLFINCKPKQEAEAWWECDSYCLRATKRYAEPSHRPTPVNVAEKHGWLRDFSAFKKICERVQNPNLEAARLQEDQDAAARLQQVKDAAARLQEVEDEAARLQEVAREAARLRKVAREAARVQDVRDEAAFTAWRAEVLMQLASDSN
ncbi:hypothetical protein BDV95DRAFT_605270 [Massariosphaeria phaeospora]|uniref:Uncharacterized protein n=1 Tax=Massariosphaeria phaeospora TaxID=100035 RepID=A0A7C8IDU5_9PLEO|nr:hypothetical protein BDV95DRAFT_605270 [Massariosphaeria phaeospora]